MKVNVHFSNNYKHDIGLTIYTIYPIYPGFTLAFPRPFPRTCDIVHQYGGQVYMDGANMNAQLGLTSPGIIGADVCHLNLHKTFSNLT